MQIKSNQHQFGKAFAIMAMTISIIGTSGIALAMPYVHSAKLVGGAITTIDWNNIGNTLNGIDNSGGAGTSWGFGMTSTGTATIETVGGIIVNAGGADITGVVTANDGVVIDTITLDASTITDTATIGLSYAGDYSVNNVTNDRWLVDKGYVDGAISSSALTFQNGITNTAGVVELGGSLIKNTTLTGTDSNLSITLYDSSGNRNANYFSPTSYQAFVEDQIKYASSLTLGIELAELKSEDWMGGTIEKLVLTPTSAIFTSNSGGIKYASDYFANFTDRSLVDKGYVDGAITAGVTASNGLTKTGADIQLGGTLTKNTEIYSPSYGITFKSSYLSGSEYMAGVDIQPARARLFAADGDFSGNINSLKSYVEADGANGDITLMSARFMKILANASNTTFAGIEYAADYSANYTNRSLVDKAYVDNATSGALQLDRPASAAAPVTTTCDELSEVGTLAYTYTATGQNGTNEGKVHICAEYDNGGVQGYIWVAMSVFGS